MAAIELYPTTVDQAIDTLFFAKAHGFSYAYDGPALGRLFVTAIGSNPRLTPEFFHNMNLHPLFVDMPRTPEVIAFQESVWACSARPAADVRRKPSVAFKTFCGAEFCARGTISRGEAVDFIQNYAKQHSLWKEGAEVIVTDSMMRDGLDEKRLAIPLVELETIVERMFASA